jgi:Na+-driven multidrug efflux pump
VRDRSWAEIRWRQFRNAPRPVFRAVVSDLAVAGVLGLLYLAYDVALSRGAHLPGGDLRVAAGAVLVAVVVCVGSVVTFIVVPAPGFAQAAGRGRRSMWSGALGFLAAVPIAYLTLVVAIQVLKPILV